MKKVTGMAVYCLMGLCCLATRASAQHADPVNAMEKLKSERAQLVSAHQSTRNADRTLAMNGIVMPATVVRTVTGNGIELRFEDYLSGNEPGQMAQMVRKVNKAEMKGLIRFEMDAQHQCVLLLSPDIQEPDLKHIFSALGYNGYVEKP